MATLDVRETLQSPAPALREHEIGTQFHIRYNIQIDASTLRLITTTAPDTVTPTTTADHGGDEQAQSNHNETPNPYLDRRLAGDRLRLLRRR